jgi:hypothetical protein
MDPVVKKLLNDFHKTQPALNIPGKPFPEGGVKLGDLIASLEATVAAQAALIADLEARVTVLETP